MTGCPWWSGWWHRRLRAADVELMWPVLLARAESEAEARLAWDVFLAQPGQQHWRCACGEPVARLFQTVTVTLAP